MSDGMLLGIDEGTTGVKAALFDQRLQPVGEARRDKVNRHPREGWVEQDGEEVIAAVAESVAELLDGADGEVIACGLDHQGESVLAWDSETGKPLSPIVVWQDKRSQEVLDTLTEEEDEVKELSGLPFDPYFSAAKLAWLLKNDDDVKKRASPTAACGWGPSTPSSATSSAPASPPNRPPRRVPSSSGSTGRAGTSASARSSAFPWRSSPRSARQPATSAR